MELKKLINKISRLNKDKSRLFRNFTCISCAMVQWVEVLHALRSFFQLLLTHCILIETLVLLLNKLCIALKVHRTRACQSFGTHALYEQLHLHFQNDIYHLCIRCKNCISFLTQGIWVS